MASLLLPMRCAQEGPPAGWRRRTSGGWMSRPPCRSRRLSPAGLGRPGSRRAAGACDHQLDTISARNYVATMIGVIGTDEFAAWYSSLGADDTRAVDRLVDLLEEAGVLLGYPYSSALKGSKHALRDLRHR